MTTPQRLSGGIDPQMAQFLLSIPKTTGIRANPSPGAGFLGGLLGGLLEQQKMKQQQDLKLQLQEMQNQSFQVIEDKRQAGLEQRQANEIAAKQAATAESRQFQIAQQDRAFKMQALNNTIGQVLSIEDEVEQFNNQNGEFLMQMTDAPRKKAFNAILSKSKSLMARAASGDLKIDDALAQASAFLQDASTFRRDFKKVKNPDFKEVIYDDDGNAIGRMVPSQSGSSFVSFGKSSKKPSEAFKLDAKSLAEAVKDIRESTPMYVGVGENTPNPVLKKFYDPMSETFDTDAIDNYFIQRAIKEHNLAVEAIKVNDMMPVFDQAKILLNNRVPVADVKMFLEKYGIDPNGAYAKNFVWSEIMNVDNNDAFFGLGPADSSFPIRNVGNINLPPVNQQQAGPQTINIGAE